MPKSSSSEVKKKKILLGISAIGRWDLAVILAAATFLLLLKTNFTAKTLFITKTGLNGNKLKNLKVQKNIELLIFL